MENRIKKYGFRRERRDEYTSQIQKKKKLRLGKSCWESIRILKLIPCEYVVQIVSFH